MNQVVVVADKLQRRQCQQGRHDGYRKPHGTGLVRRLRQRFVVRAALFEDIVGVNGRHQASSGFSPKRPCGRTRSTTNSATKKVKVDQVAPKKKPT